MDRLGLRVKQRIRARFSGRVQGVGFRPTVYRYAVELGLSGFVMNSVSGVILEAEGDGPDPKKLVERIRSAPPPQARIDSVEVFDIPLLGEASDAFTIRPSRRSGDLTVGMPPDIATCEDCLGEMNDSKDRRYSYPFINCTNCGPRFTIIGSLPYDRPETSMRSFEMCPDCDREYHDPLDRRFDAQPNACAKCGPRITLIDAQGEEVSGDPLEETAALLKQGGIVAVKGLGGYHLCCDAGNDEAIRRLRARKKRPHKALAVMFRDIHEIEACCEISDAAERELLLSARPITIVRKKKDAGLSRWLSPDTGDVGVFLPYTPLHHLLLARIGPLVMTSGNFCDEPIVKDEDDLGTLLGIVADHALIHDRPILRRCDDSVTKVTNEWRIPVRRSRGFVPDGIRLPDVLTDISAVHCVVATGAELKNTFAVTRGDSAFLSQHVGDLVELKAHDFFRESLADLCDLLRVQPDSVAHDLHPDYMASRHALTLSASEKVGVQHHHAHIAACMGENNLSGEVIGVALDGMGFGEDDTVWGGEFLATRYSGCRRLARFKRYEMPGGDQATLHPVRMAYSILYRELGGDEERIDALLPGLDKEAQKTLSRLIVTGINAPRTSSAGRLFDAVSALLGLCDTVTYEGQAAIRLQALADRADSALYKEEDRYTSRIVKDVLDFGPMIRGIVEGLEAGLDRSIMAAEFHKTIASGTCGVCDTIREHEGINRVVLSGGVFQNELLLKLTVERLRQEGFEVHTHSRLPPNDACIAYGQAVVALAKARQNRA